MLFVKFALSSQKFQHPGRLLCSSVCFQHNSLWLKLLEWSAHLLTSMRKLSLSSTSPEFHIHLLWRRNTGCTWQKMQCTDMTWGRKVVLGNIKGPCGLIFYLHKPLAPKFSTRMLYPDFSPSTYLLFRGLLGYVCFSVYLPSVKLSSMKLSNLLLSPQ